MKLFIGIKIKGAMAEACMITIDELQAQKKYKNLGWTSKENLHVTLCFLGELNEAQVKTCVSFMKEMAKDIESFTLVWQKVIAFPKEHGPLLAVAVHYNDTLNKLIDMLKQLRESLNLASDNRPFLPHITLGRSKRVLEKINIDWLGLPPTQVVTDITLFESCDVKGQRVYKPLHIENL